MKIRHHRAILQTASSLLVASVLAAGADISEAGETAKLTGPYFGQQPPGLAAELFAPDLISKEGRYEYAVSFAPGGQRLLFSVQTADGTVQVRHSRTIDGVWTDPEPVSLAAGAHKDEMSQIYWVDSAVIHEARRRQLVEETVRDSIAWALTKDRARLEEIIAHDDDYFSFHPGGLDGVHGYAEFERGFDLWMDPRFEATRTEVRNFRCHFSASGEVAWFSAILDDCYRWDGEPGCWKDTRWTGVLEHRDGRWQMMQMHFSFASDRDDDTSDEAAAAQ